MSQEFANWFTQCTMKNAICFFNSNMKFNNSIIYSLKLGLDYKGGIMAYVLVVTQVAYATFDAELAVSCQIIFPSSLFDIFFSLNFGF